MVQAYPLQSSHISLRRLQKAARHTASAAFALLSAWVHGSYRVLWWLHFMCLHDTERPLRPISFWSIPEEDENNGANQCKHSSIYFLHDICAVCSLSVLCPCSSHDILANKLDLIRFDIRVNTNYSDRTTDGPVGYWIAVSRYLSHLFQNIYMLNWFSEAFFLSLC